MNTVLRIFILMLIIASFYFLSYKMTKDKHNEDNKWYDYKDIIYYAMSVIAIISIMIFTFPTYIPLAWNKIVVLAIVLVAFLVAYYVYYFTLEGYTAMCVPLIAIIATLIFATYFPITGKQQFEEPLTATNTYSITVSSDDENEFAVRKSIEDNKEYYYFTYLDQNQKLVDVKTTDVESDIIVHDSEEGISTVKVEDALYIYEHTEITDEGENFTFDNEIMYTVDVSKDLYFDTTKG